MAAAFSRTVGLGLAGALAAAGACSSGDSGVTPPYDRIFFPTGLLVDPGSRWLFVANSNSDLRYNAGTLAVVDLDAVAAARGQAWPDCPPVGSEPDPARVGSCCHDPLDRQILDCDDRPFVREAATVRIGSFAGVMAAQTYRRGGQDVLRLYVPVRAEPSLTIVDVTTSPEAVVPRCTGPRPGGAPGAGPGGAHPVCEETWKVRRSTLDPALELPQEPYALALDDALGNLYVGHLLGGQVSLVDVCHPDDPASPRLLSVHEHLFPADGNGHEGVTALTLPEAGDPDGRLWAASRFTPGVAAMRVRGPTCGGRDALSVRDVALVGAGGFVSTAFNPAGVDIRGVAWAADRQTVYVLHRLPAAVVFIDARVDAGGNPVFRPSAAVETCAGPTALAMHDAGHGPQLFVTCYESGQIFVVDAARASLSAVIDIGRGPARLVFPAGDATVGIVAGFADNNLSVLDLAPASPTEYRVVQRIGYARAVPR